MTTQELHLELLLGKWVVDKLGDRIGPIEEVRAEQQGEDWVIVEYWIGISAIVERLSAWSIGIGFLRFLGARNVHKSYRVPWDQLDLSDLEHPRLRCTLGDLKEISQDPPSKS